MPHDTPAANNATRVKEDELNFRNQMTFSPDNSALQLAPQYKVRIFNLLPVEWNVEKGSVGTFRIQGCEPGADYSEPLVLPSVVTDSYFIEMELKTHSVSGEFMAQDILHPQVGKNWSFGQNLDELGCFWTKNEKPTEAEMITARRKMEDTGRKLLSMATKIETAGKLDDITPLMRVFATYFGEDRPWNRIYKKLADCPGCGEPVKPNIIRHSCGFVFDPDRAVLAGMISPDQHKVITAELEKRMLVEKKSAGKTSESSSSGRPRRA